MTDFDDAETRLREATVFDYWHDKFGTFGSCLVSDFRDGRMMYRLHVKANFRRCGIARKIVEAVIAATDKPLYLRPEPYLDEPIDAAQLTAFYRSCGFRIIEPDADGHIMRAEK